MNTQRVRRVGAVGTILTAFLVAAVNQPEIYFGGLILGLWACFAVYLAYYSERFSYREPLYKQIVVATIVGAVLIAAGVANEDRLNPTDSFREFVTVACASLYLGSPLVARDVALKKNRNAAFWCAATFLLGGWAFTSLYLLPALPRTTLSQRQAAIKRRRKVRRLVPRGVTISTDVNVVRVTINLRKGGIVQWLGITAQVTGLLVFVFAIYRYLDFGTSSWDALFVIALANAVAVVIYQVFGLQVIEFQPEKLVIAQRVFRWACIREYSLAACRDLNWDPGDGEGGRWGLRCEIDLDPVTLGDGIFRSKTLRFADYISKAEAQEIFAMLEAHLPRVSHQIRPHPTTEQEPLLTTD